jgi:hypothetical protein
MPTTWLNGGRWMDDPADSTSTSESSVFDGIL